MRHWGLYNSATTHSVMTFCITTLNRKSFLTLSICEILHNNTLTAILPSVIFYRLLGSNVIMPNAIMLSVVAPSFTTVAYCPSVNRLKIQENLFSLIDRTDIVPCCENLFPHKMIIFCFVKMCIKSLN